MITQGMPESHQYHRTLKHKVTGIDIDQSINRYPFVAFRVDDGSTELTEWF